MKRMGITETLRRIWLFSANKIKISESVSRQPTQLIVEVNSSLRHIIVTKDYLLIYFPFSCTSTGRSANFKILGQAIRNSFRTKKYFKKKGSKLGYLPVGSLCDGHEFSPTISPNMSINSRSEADSVKMISAANNKHTTTSVVSEDDKPMDMEHSLIAEYCRMIQDRCHETGGDASNNIETNIKELECERKALLAEYRDLTQKVPTCELADLELGSPPALSLHLDEETKNLKAQTVRMEARMKILLDHNHQLESQLKRLRQLVNPNNKNEGQFGTLQSRSVVAQDLHIQSPNQNCKCLIMSTIHFWFIVINLFSFFLQILETV